MTADTLDLDVLEFLCRLSFCIICFLLAGRGLVTRIRVSVATMHGALGVLRLTSAVGSEV